MLASYLPTSSIAQSSQNGQKKFTLNTVCYSGFTEMLIEQVTFRILYEIVMHCALDPKA